MLNVHLRITDAATNRPTPARVRVTASDGTHYPPLGRALEFPAARNADVGGHLWVKREKWWYIDGACEVPLPAGLPLRVQVAKGPEFTALDETVALGAGQIAMRFAIARRTNSHADGWVSVDTRCHFIPPHAAMLEARAEGIDVVNLLALPFPVLALDGNTYTTTPNLLAFSGQVASLGDASCSVVVNTFNAHPVLGKVALLNSHRPVFPLSFGGGEDSDDWGICDWCDQCHRKKGLTVWADAFEPAGGLIGGEALVAAILGKIDAIEVAGEPRKVPLLPWVYRLWDAGFLVPLVGASGKDSNRVRLGTMRTYVESRAELWLDGVRAGRTCASAGPLLTLTRDGDTFRVPEGAELVTSDGWVATRAVVGEPFAHTSPIAIGTPAPKPEAVAALRTLVEQTYTWAEAHGRYAHPKRKQALLDRCSEAVARLGTTP